MSVSKPSDSIQKENTQFLEELKPGQEVGIDEKGKLYTVSPGETKEEIVSAKVFAEASPQIATIGKKYAFESLSKKEFHQIEEGPAHFQELVKKLTESHLINQKDLDRLVQLWYAQRFHDLVTQGKHEKVAEAIVTIEMTQDPNIPEEQKKIFRPILTEGGLSGSYFIRDRKGEIIGIFKPADEEMFTINNPEEKFRGGDPQLVQNLNRKGCLPGTGWQKEVAASEIDQLRGGIFGVPYTAKIVVPFPERKGSDNIIMKTGSFQVFVKGKSFNKLSGQVISTIPKEQAQFLMVFDILSENTDRIAGNIFYDEKSQKLYLIDQGSCWSFRADYKQENPNEIESELVFSWSEMPQGDARLFRVTNLLPFGYATLEKRVEEEIFRDDTDKIEILRKNQISEESIRVIKLRKIFLQECLKEGLTLNQAARLLKMQTRKGKTWADEIAYATRMSLEEGKKYEDETLFIQRFKEVLHANMAQGKKHVDEQEKRLKKIIESKK